MGEPSCKAHGAGGQPKPHVGPALRSPACGIHHPGSYWAAPRSTHIIMGSHNMLRRLLPLCCAVVTDGRSGGSYAPATVIDYTSVGGPVKLQGQRSLFCDTQPEMFQNGLMFVNAACCKPSAHVHDGEHQGTDACPCDEPPCGLSQLPHSCSSFQCSRSVRRVRNACAPLWELDHFLATWRQQIASLDNACGAGVTLPKRILGFQGNSGKTIEDPCGLTITDGLDMAGAASRNYFLQETMSMTFIAPPRQVLKLDFDHVWLPEGLEIKVYDGFDALSPVLETLTGTKPAAPLVTSDWLLYLETSYTEHIPTTEVPAIQDRKPFAFSLRIECKCSAATALSCGAHGTCEGGECHCLDGYTGDFCEAAPGRS